MTTSTAPGRAAAAARLRPLRIALVLQGIAPWVPVEKVFMTQLGFTPALFALMAAAYGATVPLLEIPAGILADRWSRRGVLMLASLASLASVLVGGLSRDVPTYIASAMLLGGYFALQSGTVDAIVYDTLVEEVGGADGFEQQYGRIQALSSLALTVSALAGGVVAALLSPRSTYLLTIPTSVAGLLMLARFREPTLHRAGTPSQLRAHLTATWQTVTRRPGVASIAVTMMLAAAMTQMLLEFGPLWLIATAVPTVLFGPYTAAMTSTLGVGALVAGRIKLGRPAVATAVALTMSGCGVILAVARSAPLLVAAQVVLVGLLVTIGVHLSRRLHDLVPSHQRSGVSSGVGTMSWLTFLPCSLLFAALSGSAGIRAGGWIVTAVVTIAGVSLVRIARRAQGPDQAVPDAPASAAPGRMCADAALSPRPSRGPAARRSVKNVLFSRAAASGKCQPPWWWCIDRR